MQVQRGWGAWSVRKFLPPQRAYWPGWRPLAQPPAAQSGRGTRQECLAPPPTPPPPFPSCLGCAQAVPSAVSVPPRRRVLRGPQIGRRDVVCLGRHRGMRPGLDGRGVGGWDGNWALAPHRCGPLL